MVLIRSSTFVYETITISGVLCPWPEYLLYPGHCYKCVNHIRLQQPPDAADREILQSNDLTFAKS